MIALLMIAHVSSVVLLWVYDEGNLRAVGTCYAGVNVERCGSSRVTGTCDADIILEHCGIPLETCRHDGQVLQ